MVRGRRNGVGQQFSRDLGEHLIPVNLTIASSTCAQVAFWQVFFFFLFNKLNKFPI